MVFGLFFIVVGLFWDIFWLLWVLEGVVFDDFDWDPILAVFCLFWGLFESYFSLYVLKKQALKPF